VTTAQDGSDDLRAMPLAAGYTDIRSVAALTCARQGLLFITALIVGLNEAGYAQRYCYEHGDEAWVALSDRAEQLNGRVQVVAILGLRAAVLQTSAIGALFVARVHRR
jgi:hypothetical protein